MDGTALLAAYATLKQGSLWTNSGRCKGFSNANPGEAAKIDAYVAGLAAGGTPTAPALTTATGKGIVGMLAAMAVAAPPPPPPPPPPPSGTSARPYDALSPWNVPISDNVMVAPASQTWINAVADNNLPLTCDPDQYTIPVVTTTADTPLRTVRGNGYFSSYDSGDSSRVGHGSPWTVQVPIPDSAPIGVGSDGQLEVVDWTLGIQWGFWQLTKQADGTYTASNGYRYHIGSGYFGRFADGLAGRGAGTPYLAGLVRKWEIEQGHIDHALAFAYHAPAGTFVYPASKSDGANFGGVTGIDMPEGSRLQLDPAWNVASLATLTAQVIARALQVYGAYCIDNSGSSKIYLEDRRTAGWDASVTRSLVSGIPWSAFRIVSPPAPS